MTGYTRHDLPAEISVFAGDFASQPDVFAHLLTEAPVLDLGHVEVIRADAPPARLASYFAPEAVIEIRAGAEAYNTLVLILPAAFETLDCPFRGSAALQPLGGFRGTVPRLIADGAGR